jgi:predicted RNase H-like HicB family nuclease
MGHVHEAVLEAANRAAGGQKDGTFTPDEIVRALPQFNESTVRTHVVSRCCVNAPKNHLHKWAYFRRVSRGVYQIEPKYRKKTQKKPSAHAGGRNIQGRDTIHAVIHKHAGVFTAECLEIAVVTQGETLDEVVANLSDAVDLHLEGEDPGTFGLTTNPRLQLTYDVLLAS